MRRSHGFWFVPVLLLAACSRPPEHGTVPATLQAVETRGESLLDLTPSAPWPTAEAVVKRVAGDWAAYQKDAGPDHLPGPAVASLNAALGQLTQAVTAKQAPAAVDAANQLCLQALDLFETFDPALPSDLGRLRLHELDLLRQLSSSDPTGVNEALAHVTAVWQHLRLTVVEHCGKPAAKQVDHALATQFQGVALGEITGMSTSAREVLRLLPSLARAFEPATPPAAPPAKS